jgi:hypothetical protein
MTQPGPTEYPSSWRPPGAPEPQPETASAIAVRMAIESFLAAISDAELDDLLSRTRPSGGGR